MNREIKNGKLPKLMILGAGTLQLPAIQKAKSLGLKVIVVDMDSKAPGVSYADEFHKISTNDISGILAVARNCNPNGIMTIATDMPVRSVAAVAEKLKLQAISSVTAEKATDKIKMIQCFEKFNVPHPWFEIVSSETEYVKVIKSRGFPFIIKPNDSSGSRGVVLVRDHLTAIADYHYSRSISKSGLVLVEEFMQGPEVSVEIIKINGVCHILAITDKLTTGAPFFVEMGHSQPSSQPCEIINKIKEVSIMAVEAIGIDNSAAHVEIIVTKDGPKLVELGARMGGDCITTHLVPLSTGIDMVEACILLALGKKPNLLPRYNMGAAIRYMQCEKGILRNIEGLDKVLKMPNIKNIEFTKQKGDNIFNIKGSGDRVGYVISQDCTAESAIHWCDKAMAEIKIIIDKD